AGPAVHGEREQLHAPLGDAEPVSVREGRVPPPPGRGRGGRREPHGPPPQRRRAPPAPARRPGPGPPPPPPPPPTPSARPAPLRGSRGPAACVGAGLRRPVRHPPRRGRCLPRLAGAARSHRRRAAGEPAGQRGAGVDQAVLCLLRRGLARRRSRTAPTAPVA